MPGKVNPTQCEAVTMVCAQVKSRDCEIDDRILRGGRGGREGGGGRNVVFRQAGTALVAPALPYLLSPPLFSF